SSDETTFTVTFDGLNPAVRRTAPIANQVIVSGGVVTITLADHFADGDGNATYTLVPVGENRTVDAVIANGQLILNARGDLSGLAVFDLVASDDRGTASTRFSVITYPTVTVSDRVRYTATGEVEIDVVLSNPSAQPLTLRYDLSAIENGEAATLSGVLRF